MNFLAFNTVQFAHVDYKWHTQLFCLHKFPNFKELSDSSLQSEDMQLTELSQLYSAPAGGLSCFSFKNTFHLIPHFPEDIRQDWMLRRVGFLKAGLMACGWIRTEGDNFVWIALGFSTGKCNSGFTVFWIKPARAEHWSHDNVYLT